MRLLHGLLLCWLCAPAAAAPLKAAAARNALWAPALAPMLQSLARSPASGDSPALGKLASLDFSQSHNVARLGLAIESLRVLRVPTPEHLETIPEGERRAILNKALGAASSAARLDLDDVFDRRLGQTLVIVTDRVRAYELAERALLENAPYLEETELARLRAELPRLLRERDESIRRAEQFQRSREIVDEHFETAASQWSETPSQTDDGKDPTLSADWWKAGGSEAAESMSRARPAPGGPPGPLDKGNEAASVLMRSIYMPKLRVAAASGRLADWRKQLESASEMLATRWAKIQEIRRASDGSSEHVELEYKRLIEPYFTELRALERRYPFLRELPWKNRRQERPLSELDLAYLHATGIEPRRLTPSRRQALGPAMSAAWSLRAAEHGMAEGLPKALPKLVDEYARLSRADRPLGESLLRRGAGPLPNLAELLALRERALKVVRPQRGWRWPSRLLELAGYIIGSAALTAAALGSGPDAWGAGAGLLILGAIMSLALRRLRRVRRVDGRLARLAEELSRPAGG